MTHPVNGTESGEHAMAQSEPGLGERRVLAGDVLGVWRVIGACGMGLAPEAAAEDGVAEHGADGVGTDAADGAADQQPDGQDNAVVIARSTTPWTTHDGLFGLPFRNGGDNAVPPHVVRGD